MLSRLTMVWVTVRDSLWFIPAVLTISGSALAILLVGLERRGAIAFGTAEHWLVGGGAEGARGVLSAIAGGLITVTGVVFSVTIVALQLASSQFTPRVLRNFTADRSNQLVLGVFIGTFTYTLLVLRTVQSSQEDLEPFVPRLAVTFAVVLVLISIGSLIYFIDHSARSIQVSVILDRVTRLTLHQIDTLFPENVAKEDPLEAEDLPAPDDQFPIAALESGYLQAVDAERLFELGEKASLTIRMERLIGDFVVEGQILARLTPGEVVGEKQIRAIRNAFVLGSERTPEQDVDFGLVEISDIAVKALSPGINDPTTALACIDRLTEILRTMGTRRMPEPTRSEVGRIHFVARFTRFERALGLAFDQIRHYGSGNPTIAKKLIDMLVSLEELVPEHHAPALRRQAQLVIDAARRNLLHDEDLDALDQVRRRPREGKEIPSGE